MLSVSNRSNPLMTRGDRLLCGVINVVIAIGAEIPQSRPPVTCFITMGGEEVECEGFTHHTNTVWAEKSFASAGEYEYYILLTHAIHGNYWKTMSVVITGTKYYLI